MNHIKHGCFYVLAIGQQCGKPVKYKMVNDGGEPGAPLIRDYAPFCPEHTAIVAARKEEEE